jgi:hypothetical protein
MRSIIVTKSDGFITADNYAAVPWAKRLVIIYNGQQIGDVSTERQANLFIKKHRADNSTGVSKFTN